MSRMQLRISQMGLQFFTPQGRLVETIIYACGTALPSAPSTQQPTSPVPRFHLFAEVRGPARLKPLKYTPVPAARRVRLGGGRAIFDQARRKTGVCTISSPVPWNFPVPWNSNTHMSTMS